MRLVRNAALLWGAAMVVLVVGCVPGAPSRPETSGAVPIEPMTPSAKRATIATSFPAEVPVPVGDFTRAESQGDDAWDYVVEVSATPEGLIAWFRAAYLGRQWEQVGEEVVEDSSGNRTTLLFRKGNAESSVSVIEEEPGGPVSASVTLGVGAPVLQTQ